MCIYDVTLDNEIPYGDVAFASNMSSWRVVSFNTLTTVRMDMLDHLEMF